MKEAATEAALDFDLFAAWRQERQDKIGNG
jgi:hypothetical protein